MANQSFDTARDKVARMVSEHRKMFLVEGILLTVLGLLAVAVPVIANLTVAVDLTVDIVFGWLFLISGIVGLFTTFAMRHAPGFWWSLMSGVLGIVLGGWLLVQPGLELAPLFFPLIAFFIIEGAATIMFALEHRRALSRRWGWMLVSGIVDLFLAAALVIGLPGTALWLFILGHPDPIVDLALGLIVGINMVFGGASMIGIALAGHAEMPQRR